MEDCRMAKSTRLHEITIIRPIIIVLLVLMHSFTMFRGGKTWPLPEGIHPVGVYSELARFTFGFLLEAFVFISGYLFSSQLQYNNISLFSIIKKKAHRLLLPSIVFGVLYCLLILGDGGTTLQSFVYNVLNGSGHLWFLPMLFWCFIFGFVIANAKVKEEYKFAFCLLCTMVSGVLGFLPFQLGKVCYYLFFFILGMSIYQKKQKLQQWLSLEKVVLLIVAYIFCYVFLSMFKEDLLLLSPSSLFGKIGRSMLFQCSTLIYSTVGLMSLFCAVLYWLNKHPSWQPSSIWVNANMLCFGVYIYHQFILKYLYYKTSFPSYVDTYALPWLGFGVSLLISMLLTWITRKGRVGHFVLG